MGGGLTEPVEDLESHIGQNRPVESLDDATDRFTGIGAGKDVAALAATQLRHRVDQGEIEVSII